MTLYRGEVNLHALKRELAAEVLASTGKLRVRVTGSSMLPSILPGDVIELAAFAGGVPRKGQIVLYQRGPEWYVHRVVDVRMDNGKVWIVSKGDSLPNPDPPAPASSLMGWVAAIERNGRRFQPAEKPTAAARAVAWLASRSSQFARAIVWWNRGRHRRSLARPHRLSEPE